MAPGSRSTAAGGRGKGRGAATRKPGVFGRKDLTYDTYLKVRELLQLQQCLSDPAHHDEMLFIIIHQSYELWFKLILLELENAMAYMAQGKVLRAHHFLRRAVEIQKLLVGQIHILETMTPIEFLGFRDHLKPASGFQSVQFREIEFVAGLKHEGFFRHFEDQEALAALRRRAQDPDLWQRFQELLGEYGFDVPKAIVRDDTPPGPERERLLKTLTRIYSDPENYMEIYLLAEAMVDLDTQISLWRFHHVKVVERIIGGKTGTGGSSGVTYLETTVGKKCFPLLWEVRSYLAGGGSYGSPDGGKSAGVCPFH